MHSPLRLPDGHDQFPITVVDADRFDAGIDEL